MLSLQEQNQEFSLPLLHHLLSQTDLERTCSCQHEAKASAHLPLMAYTRNRVCRRKFNLFPNQLHSGKHFSILLTRKGVSFFGNTWALPLSRVFNIPFNRRVLHILSAHLPSEMQHGTEITALAQTQTSVDTAQFNTAQRCWFRSQNRYSRVHVTRPAPLSFLTFQQDYMAQVQCRRSAQLFFLGL